MAQHFPIRDYQAELAELAIRGNSIVFLDTGKGQELVLDVDLAVDTCHIIRPWSDVQMAGPPNMHM